MMAATSSNTVYAVRLAHPNALLSLGTSHSSETAAKKQKGVKI